MNRPCWRDCTRSAWLRVFKVKGQRIRRNAELLGDLARGHPFGSGLHEQAIDLQATVLRKRCQGFNGGFRFHTSRIVEFLSGVKADDESWVSDSN